VWPTRHSNAGTTNWPPQRLAQPKEHEAPEVVCLDEFALQKGHKYGVNLMDAQTGHIWQVTEGRSREQVRNALQQWPFRKAPHVVVTDLAPGMAETVSRSKESSSKKSIENSPVRAIYTPFRGRKHELLL